jgi:hypothetical protein
LARPWNRRAPYLLGGCGYCGAEDSEKVKDAKDSDKEKIIIKELAATAAFSFAQLRMIFLPQLFGSWPAGSEPAGRKR